jgi:hypothetical protein
VRSKSIGTLSSYALLLPTILVGSFYAWAWFEYHGTKVSGDEVVVGHVNADMTVTVYALDRKNGDQKLQTFGGFPGISWKSDTIEYDGQCQCIKAIHRNSDGDKLYVGVNKADKTAFVITGLEIRIGRTVPLHIVEKDIVDAEATLAQAQKRFASQIQHARP